MYFLLLLLTVASSQALNCTISSVNDISSVVEQCTNITIGNLEVPDGQVLEFNLKMNSEINFVGHVKFGVSYQDQTPLLRVTGTDIAIIGGSGHVLDGQGGKYWDGKGINSEKRKPVLLEIQGESATILDLNISNCPQTCIRVFKSRNIYIKNTTIDVSDGNYEDLGVDTHGIAIANSSYVTVRSADINNQGDCVVVNQGYKIDVGEVTCNGSLGLTVRPEWELANYINNVNFTNCTIKESQTGIKVVTSPHQASGVISNVIYEDIQVEGILFRGIEVRQDLDDDGHPSDNVEISKLNISRVNGTMTTKYVRSVYIWCGTDACADWTWSDIEIRNAQVENACNCIPMGWSCW
ncbi:uncharacterized protein LOC130899473 [Diorhabda carinulata]|uniref:uncharacterized protein LOC130899473 n=1 Tax=Diorhabda carinulata TaxID=1163345 RepID=UPI0025A197AB|nr:uncharacterized protein LOC130899473 [Diorhabda carinulata]